MLWLIWQMWFFLLIAFGIGLAVGWRLWSSGGEAGRSHQAALNEIDRLRFENDNLSRQLAMANVATASAPDPVVEDAMEVPAEPVGSDDLTELKGLGPKAAEALNAGGVSRFAQIAAWSDSDIADWDARLNARGRIDRDDWVGQAKDKV